MIKRIVSAVLILGLLLTVLPLTALAAPQLQVITVRQAGRNVREKGDRALAVYTNGFGDLLISGEDLEECTGFLYDNDGKNAVFTRGAKVVEVELSTGKLTPLKGQASLSRKECISEPMKVGEQWYFSAASLLPWLNVSCDVQDGRLVIIPDDYSFWDVWGELDLGEFDVFSYGDLIKEFAWNSKVVKAMNFTNDHLGEKFLEGVRYTDEFDGSVKDYFNILECLLLDSTHSEYLADTIHDVAGLGADVAGIIFGDFDAIFTAFKVVSDGIYYAAQYAAFTANHSDKMELIDSLLLNRNAYTPQLADGALMVENTYSSWWQGILNKYVLNLDGYLVDEIKDKVVSNPIGKAILLAVDVDTKQIQKLNDRIDLMAPLSNLYSVGKARYESGGSHYVDIRDRRCHAILSLYAAGENLRTLATYSEKHDMYSLSSSYERLANDCDRWIKELTAASTSQMNDSHCYWEPDGDDEGDKTIYANKLLDMFETLAYYTPAPKGLELVEYAMLADFMEYQPLISKTWVLADGDRDGHYAFVFFGDLEQSGQIRAFQYEADTASLQSRIFDRGNMPSVEEPDLTEVMLSGSSDQLLQSMDGYFAKREDFYASQATDFNGDGVQDRLYAIVGSANMWFDRLVDHSVKYGDENPFGKDPMVTLVAAESVSSGVRVRVMRLMLSKVPKWSLEGGALTVDDAHYTYQATGEDPFYCEAPPAPPVDTSGMPLTQLLLLSYDEAVPLITDYSEFTSSDGETIYAEGWFNGSFVEVRFEKRDGQFRLCNIEVLFGEDTVAVTPELDSSASVEKAESVLQPGFSWKLTDSESEGDAVYYFHSNLYYDFPTETVWLVYIRTKVLWEEDRWGDRTFAGIQFFHSETTDENVKDLLINAYH